MQGLILCIGGVFLGFFFSTLAIVTGYLLSKNVTLRTKLKQVDSKLSSKGELFEQEDEEVDDWVNSLKEE